MRSCNDPFARPVVSQEVENASLAFAETFAPSAGAVIATVGAVTSPVTVPLASFDTAELPASSRPRAAGATLPILRDAQVEAAARQRSGA